MKNTFIKLVVQGATAFVVYQTYQAVKSEQKVQQAKEIREQKARYGTDFEISKEKQQILDEADEYLRNHAGMKYLNRVRTNEFMEQRVKALLEEKTEKLNKLKGEENSEERQLLLTEIQQLNNAYKNVKPKVTSLRDLEEPEIEKDKERYYEKI